MFVPAQFRIRPNTKPRSGVALRQHLQEAVLAESGFLHVNLLVTHYEKIPLLSTTFPRGDYQVTEEWLTRYNETWPHDSLNGLSPIAYAERARVSAYELST